MNVFCLFSLCDMAQVCYVTSIWRDEVCVSPLGGTEVLLISV